MIDARELRIGNMITYKSAADTDVEFEVSVGDMFRIKQDFDAGRDAYDPIPLTEEWLEKFGFDRRESRFLSFDIKGMDINLAWDKEGFDFLTYSCAMATDIPHIKYVHQLQNLYHALTGQELKINKDGLD